MVCGLALLASGQIFAASYESIATSLSNFTDGAKWAVTGATTCAGGTAVGTTITPTTSDLFVICPGHTLTLDADYTLNVGVLQVLGTLDLSNATLTIPPGSFPMGMLMIGNAPLFGTSTGLANTGQLISGTRPHDFFTLATARGSQTQLGNSKVSILFVGTEPLALFATTIIDYGIALSLGGTITGTAKFTDGSSFGNQGLQMDAAQTLPTIDLSAFTGTTGSGKTFEIFGQFSNTITSLKLPTTAGTEIKFIVPENQTLTINGTTGSGMSCVGSATAGTTTPNTTPITSAPFVFTASTTASSTSTFVCTTVLLPAIPAPIDLIVDKQVETFATDIEMK
ncbi:MAG: hypothetical protein RIT27_553 [Pseudomonadota bacterium]|jgi:hypothetical protein